MKRKWIGDEINTSGSYYVTPECSELIKRHGTHVAPLYRFESRFGEEYYISDEAVINKIEELLKTDEDLPEIYSYLFNLVIEKFGIIEFIVRIGHKIAEERNEGYKEGKKRMQQEMRQLIGL